MKKRGRLSKICLLHIIIVRYCYIIGNFSAVPTKEKFTLIFNKQFKVI